MKRIIASVRKSMPENDFRKLPPILALLLTVVGVVMSYVFADTLAQQSRRDFEEYTKQQTASIMGHMSNRLREYEQLLLDNVGIINVRSDITRDEWRQLVTSSKIAERFPSMLGMGYVEVMPKEAVSAHEASVRDSGMPSYRVF
ncbi:MAG: CHASE domain-containing protein, partial [Candidatus Saccharimonadales bacterium]